MAKDKTKKTVKQEAYEPKPWISMTNGIFIVSIASLGMIILTAIQTVPARGWIEGLLWALLFGALIWAIFWGLIFINRWLKH